jgi:hypothetical protein
LFAVALRVFEALVLPAISEVSMTTILLLMSSGPKIWDQRPHTPPWAPLLTGSSQYLRYPLVPKSQGRNKTTSHFLVDG